MSYLWVVGTLPGWNELIDLAKAPALGAHLYSVAKDSAEQRIGLAINMRRFKVTGTCFTYLFVEPNRRRDPSNFVSGGIKVIEDAFRRAKLMRNDGWSNVMHIRPYWITCSFAPGVMVWAETAPLSYADAFQEFLDGPGNEENRNQTLSRARPGASHDGRNLAAAVKAAGRRRPRKSR